MSSLSRAVAQTLFCVFGSGLLCLSGSGCGSSGAVSPSGTAVGVICIPSGCLSGAVYLHTVSLGSSDPLAIKFRVCRNSVCAQTQLVPGRSPTQYVGRIVGPLSVEIALNTASGALLVHVVGRPEILKDGDSYDLTVDGIGPTSIRSLIPSATYSKTPKNDSNCTADCISVAFPI